MVGICGIPGMVGILGNEPGGEGGALGSEEEEEQAQPTLESPKLPLWLARSDGLGHGFCNPMVGFGRETRQRRAAMTMTLFIMVKAMETKNNFLSE